MNAIKTRYIPASPDGRLPARYRAEAVNPRLDDRKATINAVDGEDGYTQCAKVAQMLAVSLGLVGEWHHAGSTSNGHLFCRLVPDEEGNLPLPEFEV